MSHREKFRSRVQGPVVPMPTAMKEDLSIDFDGLRRYTNFLIESGIKVISPMGTTGECFTMTPEEQKAVIKTVVETAAGRAVVIAGASHSGTAITSSQVRYVQEVGADAALVCPPYYYNSGPEAVFEHYRTVAEENDIGIVIYSNRPYMNDIKLINRLVSLENVVGVKEATNIYPLYQEWCVRHGDKVTVISGGSMRHYLWGHMWDSPAYFCSVANFVPQVELDFMKYLEQGNLDQAKRIVTEIEMPYFEVALQYDWYGALKAALEMFGLPAGPTRLPIIPITEKERQELRNVLVRIGLLKA